MRQDMGWALYSPSGNPIAETFASTKQGAESNAYDWLQCKAWARQAWLWKNWNAFVDERVRRGWTVDKARLTYI